MTTTKIVYQEESLDKILATWVKGFQPPEGQEIVTWLAIIDQVQRKVVFKLMVEVPIIVVPDNGKIITMGQ